jgi:hypothetical protein
MDLRMDLYNVYKLFFEFTWIDVNLYELKQI